MTDSYWATQAACLAEITESGKTVDDVIAILLRYYAPSSGAAFFPGGGDENVIDALTERGDWSIVWMDASYYWCAADANGDRLSFIEGDVERGNCRSRSRE